MVVVHGTVHGAAGGVVGRGGAAASGTLHVPLSGGFSSRVADQVLAGRLVGAFGLEGVSAHAVVDFNVLVDGHEEHLILSLSCGVRGGVGEEGCAGTGAEHGP